jgi:hypothetical protein
LNVSRAQYEILTYLETSGKSTYSSMTMKGFIPLALFACRDRKIISFTESHYGHVLNVTLTEKGKRVISDLKRLHDTTPNPQKESFTKRIPKLSRLLKV